MKKTVFAVIALFLCSTALDAGALRSLSFPARHPIQTIEGFAKGVAITATVASYPLRHPKKSLEGFLDGVTSKRFWVNAPVDTPMYRLAGITWALEPAHHGPTLPPDPWADVRLISIEGTF